VLVATHSTNVPVPGTVGGPFITVQHTNRIEVDFFGMKYGRVLTSPVSGVGDVTAFDDFTQTLRAPVTSDGPTGNSRYSSLYFRTITNNVNPQRNSELDHPGIWRATNFTIRGFNTEGPGSGGVIGGLFIANDFELEALVRFNYGGTANRQFELAIKRNGINNSAVLFADLQTNTNYGYKISGVTNFSSTPVPASGTWTKLRITYLAGILSFYQDNNLIHSQSTTLNGGACVDLISSSGGPGTSASLDIDYVKVNYDVTR